MDKWIIKDMVLCSHLLYRNHIFIKTKTHGSGRIEYRRRTYIREYYQV